MPKTHTLMIYKENVKTYCRYINDIIKKNNTTPTLILPYILKVGCPIKNSDHINDKKEGIIVPLIHSKHKNSTPYTFEAICL